MGAVATFSFQTFAQRFPEFANLDPNLAGFYFSEATLYLANDGSGPVFDAGQQLVLLNLLTAHIAKLNATIPAANGQAGQTPSGLVGRITSATEGSVSVATDNGPTTASAAWYQQTTYGSQFWASTALYRTARYIPGRPYGCGVDLPPFLIPRF